MTNDPIVEEVRANRKLLAEIADDNINDIIAAAQKRQATSTFRLVSFAKARQKAS